MSGCPPSRYRDRRVLLAATLVVTFAAAAVLSSVVIHTADPGYAYVPGLEPYLPAGDVWQVPDFSAYMPGYAFAQVQDTTPPVFVSSDFHMGAGVLSITFSEDIDVTPATNVVPSKIHIRESGIYIHGVTLTADELDTNTDGATISFTLTASHLATLAGMSTPELTIEAGAVSDTTGNPIGTFDVSTASFVEATSVVSQTAIPTGMAFSSNGTKMFVVDWGDGEINEYDLSSPWDASTATFVNATSVSAQENFPRGMAFSSNGTKMFVVGTQGDDINEYTLSSPWDASTATFVNATSVSAQENSPRGMAFSSDGTKMFVIGTGSKAVNEYTLSTPFDASTATFVNATSVSARETSPQGMAFSSDGTKMFVVGRVGDDINEYTLSSPWDASTADFVHAFDISEQDTDPQGMAFSSDGTKMFVVGDNKDSVNEYTLSSVYPISGDFAPPVFESSELYAVTRVLSITFSEDIDVTPATNVVPSKIHIREAGTYTGGVTLTAQELDTTSDGAVLSFTLTESHLAAVNALTVPELTIEPGAVQDTFGNLILGTFDASTAVFVDATSIQSEETWPTDVEFSNDGTKMFVIGPDVDNINEYTLSTPFDASMLDHIDATSIQSEETWSSGMAFSNDGTKMFVIGTGSDAVNEYTLSTPFDASTRTWVDATTISTETLSPRDITFSNNGTRMYVAGGDNHAIHRYTLSTPFDASTLTHIGTTSLSPQADTPQDIAFSNDGTKMFVLSNDAYNINEYDLSSPWDASTVTFVDAFDVSAQDLFPTGMAFSNDGTKMFVTGRIGDSIYEYALNSVYPITFDSSPPTFDSSELNIATGTLVITFSEVIDVTPVTNVMLDKIHIRESGTYTGGVTLTAQELDTTSDGVVLLFTLTESHLAAVKALAVPELTIEPGAVQDASANPIVGTFDASTAVFVDATLISGQESSPQDVAFSDDGTKMFVIGNNGDDINEYTLSTPFDASTRTFVDATPVSDKETNPTGMAFSNDGTKMFVIGNNGDDINEYTLSTPFDASTRVFVDDTSIRSEDLLPSGMAFSDDGTKMFVIGSIGDDINEYTLSTPFDASTRVFVDATPVSDQETSPSGMAFSNDGTKMFVIGSIGDDINEYTLSTPFDASTRTFVDATSVSDQETSPSGMAFSNDGTKMFVIGSIGDSIYEYALNSVYPIHTLPIFESSVLNPVTGAFTIIFSEAIDVTPVTNVMLDKIHIRESGTYTGGVTLTVQELDTTSDGAVLLFTLTESHLAAVKALAVPELTIEPGAVRDMSGNLIDGTFDASTAVLVGTTSISGRESSPQDVAFSNDGTKMFVIGSNGDDINEYTLSAPFDVSIRTWVDATSISSQESNPSGLAFSNDGTKMFVIGSNGDDINEYTLSAPFDVSIRTWVDATSISNRETNPTDLAFSNDGTKMFVIGLKEDKINEYTLSTPFDASTRTWVDDTPVSDREQHPTDIEFSNDGTKMFVIGTGSDAVNEYTLSTPFDASTRTWVDATSISSQENNPRGMAFSNDGTKMFVIGIEKGNINEYTLSSVYPITLYFPPLTFESSRIDPVTGVLTIAFSDAVDVTPSTNVVPSKIHIREAGTYTGGVTLTAQELDTTSDGTVLSFTLTALQFAAVKILTVPELTIEPGAVQDMSGNLIDGTFDASTAVLVDATSILSQEQHPTDIAFSNDGTKMFVVGTQGDDINEYTLSTPFDASTLDHIDATSIKSEDAWPSGLAFSNDGTKMFVIGTNSDAVNEYTLSTPFDASTSTWVDATSVSDQTTSPRDITFSNDGTRMYVTGGHNHAIHRYTLSTPFDASTLTHIGSTFLPPRENTPQDIAFSNDGAKMFVIGGDEGIISEYALSIPFVASTGTFVDATRAPLFETHVTGMAFSNDGTKMFVIGRAGDSIYEYALSSVYPVMTDFSLPTFKLAELSSITRVLTITFSEDIDVTPATNVVLDKIHIREAGTYTGGVTLTAQELDTTSDGAVLSFTLTPLHFATVNALTVPELTIEVGAVQDTFGNPILGTFDPSTAVFVGTTSISDQELIPQDVELSNDGTRMFVIGLEGADINEYTLSTPFVASTRTFVGTTSVSDKETNPTGMAFSNDGTKMFVIGTGSDAVNEYILSTPFVASTRVFVDTTSISNQETNPSDLAFSNDGTKMFVIGLTGEDINEYTLSTPFVASTRTFVDDTSFSLINTPVDIAFSNDGTRMLVLSISKNSVHNYVLSTPFDASTGYFVDLTPTIRGESLPRGMAFSNDGTKMFVIGRHLDAIAEYTLTPVYPIRLDFSPPLFFSSTPNISSPNANGTYFTGDMIDVTATFPYPVNLNTPGIVDGEGGFDRLKGANSITIVTISDKTYALVSGTTDNGVQIIDITDPLNPFAVISFGAGDTGSNGAIFTALSAPFDVTTIAIDGRTYALVSSAISHGVQIVGITDPADPIAVASVRNGSEFPELLGSRSATTVVIGENIYALVAGYFDHGVQIIDISDPASPTAVTHMSDSTDDDPTDYVTLSLPTFVTTFVVDHKTYALVTSAGDHGVQIIDISDPASPAAVASVTDLDNCDGIPEDECFDTLQTPYHAVITAINDDAYALVTSASNSGIQIINVTDPASPAAVASVTDLDNCDGIPEDECFDQLSGATHMAITIIDGKTYVLVTGLSDDGVQIIDISDPASPAAVASVTDSMADSPAGYKQLGDANAVAITTTVLGKTYALVASYSDNGVQIIDITNPESPVPVYFNPYINLDLTHTTQRAEYMSKLGLNTLSFRYVVQPGDFSRDLAYSDSAALVVPHIGNIENADYDVPIVSVLANPGQPKSLSANKDIKINTLVADAGDDDDVNENALYTLNGTGSRDPNDDPLSFEWTQDSGPTVTLTGANTDSPSFVAPAVAENTPVVFTLNVTAAGESDTDTVTITIIDSQSNAPVADAGDDDNVDEGTSYTLDGTDSTDPNDDPLSFEWTQDSGPTVTLTDANTDSPSFVAPAVAENTPMVFTLNVTAAGESDTDTVTNDN